MRDDCVRIQIRVHFGARPASWSIDKTRDFTTAKCWTREAWVVDVA